MTYQNDDDNPLRQVCETCHEPKHAGPCGYANVYDIVRDRIIDAQCELGKAFDAPMNGAKLHDAGLLYVQLMRRQKDLDKFAEHCARMSRIQRER